MASHHDFNSHSSVDQPSVILSRHGSPHEQKRSLIEDACRQNDFASLVKLATSTGGLLADDLRRKAWPILLGYQHEKESDQKPGLSSAWTMLPRHSDEDQVRLDVDRAFVYYPRDESEQSLEQKRTDLYDLIVSTLRKHPILSYFQSYHDVVQVLLLVLGKDSAAVAVPRISLLRLRDYMLPTIAPARKHFELVSAVVSIADPQLAQHLSEAENSSALSATHSLFAHDVQDYREISRLYDFLLAHEPIMSIYLFATITISRRSELLELESDQSDMLTYMVAKLPQTLDIDSLAAQTIQLFQRHPPERLRGFIWWRLSSYSVLKTSRRLDRPQTCKEAELLGRKQIQQLRRDEALSRGRKQLIKYQRPAKFTAALLIGVFSIYLRKSGLRPAHQYSTREEVIVSMANRGYDVVVDVDAEGDLGHTDLQDDDLEFHPSNFDSRGNTSRKVQPDSTAFLSNSATNPANLPNDPSAVPPKHMLWSLSFYAQFFDVDTSTVLHRCRTAILPFIPNTPPFLDTMDGNPDLYGPFWIATTVVVILFLTGTISHKLASEGKKHFEYDFRLLSGAAGLIYGYTLFVPLGLWAALRWFGAQSLELVECWALYGYSNLFWIAVALLSWSPLNGLNYALVGLGYAVSVFFLVKNLFPVISATEKKISQVLLLVVVLLHAGLAIAIKILFFSHKSPAVADGAS